MASALNKYETEKRKLEDNGRSIIMTPSCQCPIASKTTKFNTKLTYINNN